MWVSAQRLFSGLHVTMTWVASSPPFPHCVPLLHAAAVNEVSCLSRSDPNLLIQFPLALLWFVCNPDDECVLKFQMCTGQLIFTFITGEHMV